MYRQALIYACATIVIVCGTIVIVGYTAALIYYTVSLWIMENGWRMRRSQPKHAKTKSKRTRR